jgi:lipopolysaccharide/colanic/teichoic acid biosynthesis glycosyltransferase
MLRLKPGVESTDKDHNGHNGSNSEVLSQNAFIKTLCLERKRTERSRRPFVLMLVDGGTPATDAKNNPLFANILCALSASSRETDIKGWYKAGSIIGVIFTEIGTSTAACAVDAVSKKTSIAFSIKLSAEQLSELDVSFHVFPEDCDKERAEGSSDSILYPDLENHKLSSTSVLRLVKRAMDIMGSLSALILFSSLIIAIAVIIKVTSKGPMFFRQDRLGQYGKKFRMLKFRSMYFPNNHNVHEEYVKQLISGNAKSNAVDGNPHLVYKLTRDLRITPVGRLLRRTSMDELPQFFNVLAGHMSLVGPRPPIPYEFECYELWHRRRLQFVKPGITGLWQVSGRSRMKFDEMVRLDLSYARSWSIWLDLKILLQTPKAVLSGEGAY